jgi:hypothetical protein
VLARRAQFVVGQFAPSLRPSAGFRHSRNASTSSNGAGNAAVAHTPHASAAAAAKTAGTGAGTGLGADAGITSDADVASASASSTALIDATVDRLVSRKGLYKNVGGAFTSHPNASFGLF